MAVLVIPGDVLLDDAPSHKVTAIRAAEAVIRPADAELAAAADVLNAAERVTILAGAGCARAHDQLLALAGALGTTLTGLTEQVAGDLRRQQTARVSRASGPVMLSLAA